MKNNKRYDLNSLLKGIFLACFLNIALNAFAVEEPYINELKGPQVAAGNFFTVSDEKFNNSSAWNQISDHISTDNIITFEINFDTSVFFYNQPFNCTINFKIYIYGNQSDTSQITDSTTHANISLVVRYDTVTGKPYKGVALYKFRDVHKYKVKILSITCPELSPILPIFRLKGQIIANRKYIFNDNSTDVTRFSIVNGNQLKLQWTPSNYPGAEMFDLEYTHIDGSSQVATSITSTGINNVSLDSLTKWFKNNSSRITTAASEYLLDITYDSGFILFRIRGVQIHYDDNVRWTGNWNYYARHVDSSCSLPSCPRGIVLFDGHEENLNWQFSIVFAEEGRKQHVINYFDGRLANRQSVTITNAENKTIVQETIYDVLGRRTASILPAPANDSTIHYFRGFNRNLDGDPYSFSDLLYSNCNTVAGELTDTSGTSKYYSSNNSFLNTYYYAKYIPDADRYPIAVTEYVADNTGRIKAQGGVGPAFQLGSGHETSYFYGKPTQTELDRLFGTEAGNASHYLKNMVVDANGQISVSYLDARGNTIATSLAGATPPNVDTLSSNGAGTVVNVSNEIIQPTDFARNSSDFSLSATATFLAPVTGNYRFKYQLDPLEYQKLYGPNKDSVICSDCYYDLEVVIRNACDSIMGRDTLVAGNVFDTACGSNDPIIDSFDVTVNKIGEYYVSYLLKVSKDAMLFYDSVHLVENSDIKKLNYFLLEELKKTDFYGCYSHCETCIDKLGTEEEFYNNFYSLYVTDSVPFGAEDSLWILSLYDSLYANCQAIQSQCGTSICDEKLELLKMDVTPGGQYALYNSTTYALLEINVNVLAQRNQIAFFTDPQGNRDSVILVDQNGEDSVKVDVKQLNDTLFIIHWKDSWADSLVRFHPEYCFYLWCIENSNSYEFDRKIENEPDADTAIARGWFDPNDFEALLDSDPFFNGGGNGAGLNSLMSDSLELFSRTLFRLGMPDKNILEFIDVMLYCKNADKAWTDCNPDDSCRSRNREWFFYKTLYLNLKQRFYVAAMRNNPDFDSCVNCYIGQDPLTELTSSPCPDINDFTINSGSNEVTIEYVNFPGVKRRVHVVFENSESQLDTVTFNIGDLIKSYSDDGPTPGGLVEAYCDEIEFNDYLPDGYTICEDGEYTDPNRGEPYSYHIETGDPSDPPEVGGYEDCQFYSVFDLYGNDSCLFFNVWVCMPPCDEPCPVSYPSQCDDHPLAGYYQNKIRRYPEYVNADQFVNQILGNNPEDASVEYEQIILDECASFCEAQADYWMTLLANCPGNDQEKFELKQALIEICSKGCAIGNPYGTSTLPGSVSATYHSFEEAIETILGITVDENCTAELIAHPYPHDKLPVYTDRVITETDTNICEKINFYISEAGGAENLHDYLLERFGPNYQLTSEELADLVNSCENCNYILKNDIVLPIFFEPGAPPCIDRGGEEWNAAVEDFGTKFPSPGITDPTYEILVTNYFNHRFGFTASYSDWMALYNGDIEILCNRLLVEEDTLRDDDCVRELFNTALTNAYNTYTAYIDSVRKDFQDAWMTKCMNVQPRLTMKADLYEYHYTLYWHDQSGNLVKTVPPEGVRLLNASQVAQVQQVRAVSNNYYCSNNNAMVYNSGAVIFPSGSPAPHLNMTSQPFTVETWIKLSSFNDQGIMSNNWTWISGGTDTLNKGYSLSVKNGCLRFLLSEGISTTSGIVDARSLPLNSFIPLNTWVHIAAERTAATGAVKIFINGNNIPVTYIHNSAVTGNLDHGIGVGTYTGAAYLDAALRLMDTARLKHLRIYKRAVPQTEIRQNCFDACSNPVSRDGLIFWEPFTEGYWLPGSNPSLSYVYDRIYNTAGFAGGSSQQFELLVSGLVPDHKLATTYQYNSLNHVLQQYSPDGDTSLFFYDRLGLLTASQNKEQKENASYSGPASRFSYTEYDSLGRITEMGEKCTSTDIRTINLLKQDSVVYWLGTGTNRQLTKTIYDNPVNTNLQDYNTSRKRVVAAIYLENEADAEGDSTLYNYDILGNVKTLVQHIKALVAVDNSSGRKRVDYDFSLQSGKVNLVSYQEGHGDQFFYKYSYDANARVIRSYSSRDKLVWTEDASYTYYLHGPPARTELGQYKVQGMDYAYTLQGWIKGINSDSLNANYDIANDGKVGAMFSRVSRDVYGFKIGYNSNDYMAIGLPAPAFTNKAYTHPGSFENSGNQLFNGNISYTTLAMSKINVGATKGETYGYDQLNRLVEMRQHITGAAGGWSNSNIITAYRESIAYDANGNILKYLRKGTAATPDMDSLNYNYNRDGSGNLVNNRLNHVRDKVSSGNYSEDIDNQSPNNYDYDLIGNLKKDVAEGIDSIRWTVYGRINKVVKSSGANVIEYGYGSDGNRTYKKVTTSTDTTKTFYVRDAQGNVLAIYSKRNSVAIHWDEQHLHGSSRLGMWRWDTLVPASPPVVDENPVYDSLMLGNRTYELTNHLGNVLATISDKKIGNDSSGVVNYYIAEVLSQNDYYPFGMIQPGHTYTSSSKYRYGFNGKEKDKEMHSLTAYDYGFRIYNPAIGRFLSVDPLTNSYPWYTPYQFAGNKPIRFIDVDGREEASAEEYSRAIQSLDLFASKSNTKSAWPNISKTTFVDQIRQTLTTHGNSINQGEPTWLCGVAAPANIFVSRNPTAYVEKMISLYQEGHYMGRADKYTHRGIRIGEEDVKVKASPGLKDVVLNAEGINDAAGMRAVDYMLLGTTRHYLNAKSNCNPDESDGGFGSSNDCGTWPQDIDRIMKLFGLSLTKDKYWTNEDKSDYKDISTAMSAGKGVILFQNGTLNTTDPSKKGGGSVTERFGIHYVVLKTFTITYSADGKTIERVKGTYWDYGNIDPAAYKKFDLTGKQFEDAVKGIFITNK